jgi:aryl-alcohol dehydrogenase
MDTLGEGFDYIVDTTGVPALLPQAVGKLAARGTLALVGAYPPDADTKLDASQIMSMGRRIVGVVEGGIEPGTFIPRLIAEFRAGRLPMEKLVRTFPFHAIEDAFQSSIDGQAIKPVLVMPVAQAGA